ncbi:kinetochore protein Nuf2 [Mus pahari]|uniref:kinetochore protein Nuf2 n=1 Tax=Mus pahari TaxID=10093 RepID=UPI000A31370A|nr:kinetochore protein Nuf2 [Mus pahari]
METLSFPRYNVAELVVHIRNKLLTGADGKNLSKSDFLPNPKYDVLYMIYMRALQLVYGIRLEHLYMMPMNIEVTYPHLMDGFLQIRSLFFYMDSFMPICRVNDFEVVDILYPKTNRTSRFLSGIINFIHFRETCLEKYEEFLLQNKSPMDRMQQLSNAHQEDLMKLEKLNSVPVEEQEEFKQFMDDIQELQHLLNQEFRQKTTLLQEEYAKIKSDISEKTKHLNEQKLSLVSLKEIQDNLKSKIVDSPEKLKNYKDKMKATVQKLRSAREEVMGKYDIYRDSVDCLPSCQLEVQLYQKKSQALADNREKLSSLLKESLNLEDQIESDSSELKKLKTEENNLIRMITVKKEKLATMRFKISKKQEDVKQYKQAIIEDCNKVQEKRDAVCEQITTTNQEIHKIKSAIQQLKDDKNREMLKSQEIFVNLKSALEKYHEGLEKAAEECGAKIEKKAAELKRRMGRVLP